MLQACDRLRLALEARTLSCVAEGSDLDHLDGDEAVEALLLGLVNDAHATFAKNAEELVALVCQRRANFLGSVSFLCRRRRGTYGAELPWPGKRARWSIHGSRLRPARRARRELR